MIDKETFEIVRWACIVCFGLLGAYIMLLNYWILINNFIPKRKWVSAGPFLGGMFCAIALVLLPWSEVRRFWYVAFIVDYTYAMFLWFLLFYSWRKGGLFDKDVFDKTIHDPSSDHEKKMNGKWYSR